MKKDRRFPTLGDREELLPVAIAGRFSLLEVARVSQMRVLAARIFETQHLPRLGRRTHTPGNTHNGRGAASLISQPR